jgi:hypothetical protein
MTISEKEALVLTIMGASGASVDRPMTAYNVYRGAAGFDDKLTKNQVVRVLEDREDRPHLGEKIVPSLFLKLEV